MAEQGARSVRVGVICSFSPLAGLKYLDLLRERLATHGFAEGRNLTIEAKFPLSTDARDRARTSALELIADKVDVIFVLTTNLTLGAQAATESVPIVFAWVADPVAAGIVKDLRSPGGNTTGVSTRYPELIIKRLELLHELVPAAKRVAVLAWTFDSTLEAAMHAAQPTAERLGIELDRQSAPYAWASAVQSAIATGAQAMLVEASLSTSWAQDHTQLLVEQALRHRFPVVHIDHGAIELGGLVSYATQPADTLQRGADILARVLNGESPATLPVDLAAGVEMVLNLKTARAIGVDLKPSILARASRLIE